MTPLVRGLIVAPVARDLRATRQAPPVARVPNAATSTQQVWDTVDSEFWVTDSTLSVVTSLSDLMDLFAALYPLVVGSVRFDDAACTLNPSGKRLADMTATDFWRAVRSDSSVVVRQGVMQVGDSAPYGPYGQLWGPIHQWAGFTVDTLSP